MSATSVYCEFRKGYYWYAHCNASGQIYESVAHHHNSARQAADEVLAAVRADHPSATMRRLAPKVYQIEFPEANAERQGRSEATYPERSGSLPDGGVECRG
jgi:hypothetical protein